MPYSMTGFATTEAAVPPFALIWELRSVNHRFLDMSFRLPEELRALEPRCRDIAGEALHRGRLDCSLKLAAAGDGPPTTEIDDGAVARLEALADRIRHVFPEARPLTVGEVLRWPGIVREPDALAARLAEPALECLQRAIAELAAARAREGERIARFLADRADFIDVLVAQIRPHLSQAQQRHREKLEERLRRLQVEVDAERMQQEVALIAQRLDVAEEIDRLGGHVAEVRAVLERSEPIGRRLDFLIQELHREANTFAAKIQDEQLARVAVELRVVIEQMREQVQNLE